MLDRERISSALNACYAAVAEPEKWGAALQELAESIGSACAMFYPKDVNDRATIVPSSHAYGELLEEYVRGEWWQNHYRADRGWSLLQTRPFVVEHDLATDEERKSLAHYNDLYLKWNYPGFLAIAFSLDGDRWCVPFLRDREQGFFTHEEGEQFSALAPHFRRMMGLSTQFEMLRANAELDALDRLDKAAILLDDQGRALAFNKKAERLLTQTDSGIFLNGGGHIHAADPDSERNLQALVAAGNDRDPVVRRTVDVLPVPVRRPHRRPLMVEALTFGGLVSALASKACRLLLVTDLEARPPTQAERLMAVLSLTRAEAEFCVQFASGSTLSEVSEFLKITQGTARQRLKAIFQKTETNRQSELLLLIARIGGQPR